jgi:putative iron-dependent peroxidase
MSEKNWDRVPIDAQSIDAPLSRAAVFLVVTVASEQTALAKVCSALDGLDDLIKTVGFRDLSARLSCIVGIGRDLWDRFHFDKRPQELRPFARIEGVVRAAPSTPGDLLFHIRSERPDLCFEFERILLDSLGAGVTVVDEVSGFRYFDARDLLGFIDGTANPTGLTLPASALVGEEDPDFEGGSYVVVQKYLHDLSAWTRIPTPLQEEIIGRTKIDNIEINDDDAPRKSHKSLATIVDADGNECDILRDNMPFGRPGQSSALILLAIPDTLGDREDAATDVCRRPARRLRSPARFLDAAHRHNVLRSDSPDAANACSDSAGEAHDVR